jgi:hypothetical protein
MFGTYDIKQLIRYLKHDCLEYKVGLMRGHGTVAYPQLPTRFG